MSIEKHFRESGQHPGGQSECPLCGSSVDQPVSVSLETNTVMIEGIKVDLTPRQTDLMAYLTQKFPRVVSRESIMNALYGMGDSPESDRQIDVFISHINGKIKSAGYKIQNYWRRGWRLEKTNE